MVVGMKLMLINAKSLLKTLLKIYLPPFDISNKNKLFTFLKLHNL